MITSREFFHFVLGVVVASVIWHQISKREVAQQTKPPVVQKKQQDGPSVKDKIVLEFDARYRLYHDHSKTDVARLLAFDNPSSYWSTSDADLNKQSAASLLMQLAYPTKVDLKTREPWDDAKVRYYMDQVKKFSK